MPLVRAIRLRDESEEALLPSGAEPPAPEPVDDLYIPFGYSPPATVHGVVYMTMPRVVVNLDGAYEVWSGQSLVGSYDPSSQAFIPPGGPASVITS